MLLLVHLTNMLLGLNSLLYHSTVVPKDNMSQIHLKRSGTTKALEYFDSFYGSYFGAKWEKIREGLLSEPKYCAVINNFGDSVENCAQLELEGCINISDELINVDENEDRNKDSTEVIEKKGIFAVDTEPRYQAINDDDKEEMDMNFGRVIVPSKGQDFSILMDYLPATKIKGGENSAEPLDEMKYFQSCYDYEVKVVKGKPISFPAMLNVYTREKGNDEELPEPRHGVLNTSGYYCMDGASILPVLALGINPGQSVLDMCSAPGGKMYVMLQTMHPSLIIANDASKARERRIRNVLKSFVGNLEESLSTKVITSTIKAEHWTELDAFDKVLADVPCQTDRHSVIENDNNIFKPSRSRERITLPETQSGILTSSVRACKPGGTIVYSTCTLSPLQNDGVVHMTLKGLEEEHGIVCEVE
ncbi:hypothetical protein QYM36_010640 [Artemia franciscana]|uniref:NOL1/NOP2/Sun domain family member 4 n=1 Tax=Artemia franciscana TaxID=6661 RepID=A0AA88L7S6_ARTSF|nr:hypothetical protein QYM36_010640 [Artemia franciscana]